MREGEKKLLRSIEQSNEKRGKRAGKRKGDMTVISLMILTETFHSQTQISSKKKDDYDYTVFSAENCNLLFLFFFACSFLFFPSFLPFFFPLLPCPPLLSHHSSCCTPPPAARPTINYTEQAQAGEQDLGALKLQMIFLLTKLAVGRPPLRLCCEWRGLNYSCYR